MPNCPTCNTSDAYYGLFGWSCTNKNCGQETSIPWDEKLREHCARAHKEKMRQQKKKREGKFLHEWIYSQGLGSPLYPDLQEETKKFLDLLMKCRNNCISPEEQEDLNKTETNLLERLTK